MLSTPADAALALKEGLALIPLPQGVVKVTGPDRLSWLTTLSSQLLSSPLAQRNFYNPSGRPTGAQTEVNLGQTSIESTDAQGNETKVKSDFVTENSRFSHTDNLNILNKEALILSATGHIRFYLRLYDDGENCYIICSRPQELADFLESMRFMLRVEVEILTTVQVYGALGLRREIALKLGDLVQFVWNDPWPGVCPGGTAYSEKHQPHPGAGYRAEYWVFPQAHLPEVEKIFTDFNTSGFFPYVDESGYRIAEGRFIPPISENDLALENSAVTSAETGENEWFWQAWEAKRIEAGRPGEKEIDERTIPHELDWLRTAVHLFKGCYPGQETVARVVNLGRPPRRILRLEIDGSTNLVPPPNCGVFVGEKQIGKLTSFAVDHEEGPIGLALVKRQAHTRETDGSSIYLSWTEDEITRRLEARATELASTSGQAWDSPLERPGANLSRMPIASRSK